MKFLRGPDPNRGWGGGDEGLNLKKKAKFTFIYSRFREALNLKEKIIQRFNSWHRNTCPAVIHCTAICIRKKRSFRRKTL